jgi:hypothetical protein
MTEHATGTPQASPLRRSRSDRTLAGVCGGLDGDRGARLVAEASGRTLTELAGEPNR